MHRLNKRFRTGKVHIRHLKWKPHIRIAIIRTVSICAHPFGAVGTLTFNNFIKIHFHTHLQVPARAPMSAQYFYRSRYEFTHRAPAGRIRFSQRHSNTKFSMWQACPQFPLHNVQVFLLAWFQTCKSRRNMVEYFYYEKVLKGDITWIVISSMSCLPAPEKHLNRLLRFPVSIERNHKKPIDWTTV